MRDRVCGPRSSTGNSTTTRRANRWSPIFTAYQKHKGRRVLESITCNTTSTVEREQAPGLRCIIICKYSSAIVSDRINSNYDDCIFGWLSTGLSLIACAKENHYRTLPTAEGLTITILYCTTKYCASHYAESSVRPSILRKDPFLTNASASALE